MTYVFAAQKIRSKEGKKRVKKPEFKQSFEKLGLTGAILIHALIHYHWPYVMIGLCLGGLTVLLAILEWLVAARTSCPLCRVPVLAPKKCARHWRARPLLGSYRLRVALAVLVRNSFLCPYCHEPTAIQLQKYPWDENLVDPAGSDAATKPNHVDY